MNNHPFHRFIELINFDQSACALLEKNAQLEKEIADMGRQINEIEEQQVKNHRAVIEAHKTVDRMELETKELHQKEQDKKAKLSQLTHYKESASLQREIDQIQAQQHEQEDELLQAWHLLEVAVKEKERTDKLAAEKRAHVLEELERKKQEKETIINELLVYEKSREEYKHGVPQEWLEKYESMRPRVANPVVPVEGTHCSACFHELSHQEIIRLERGALLECKLCFRFLYHNKLL